MEDKRSIPSFLTEFFLLGRTRAAAVEQYMKDGGVTTDVWLRFGEDLDAQVRVLVAPVDGFGTAELGHALHRSIWTYRKQAKCGKRLPPSISPLEDYVVAHLYLDELLNVLLPLTTFYLGNRLDQIDGDKPFAPEPYEDLLAWEIRRRLGAVDSRHAFEKNHDLPRLPKKADRARALALRVDRERRRGIVAAAPVAAVIGLFAAWSCRLDPSDTVKLRDMDPRQPGKREAFDEWVRSHAEKIAGCALEVLARPDYIKEEDLRPTKPSSDFALRDPDEDRLQPLIQRIFIDRTAKLAHKEAICAVKADAAQLLFEITCKDIAWAIIDSGVAALHPAFRDHSRKIPAGQPRTRVRGTYDFTMISQIRNFDLIDGEEGSAEETKAIGDLVDALVKLPVTRREKEATFREQATEALKDVVAQLRLGLLPHWRLIEPLIAIEPDDGKDLVSDHGTHVAGTLGGDWRDGEDILLQGICPDIYLYDLRVIPYAGQRIRGAEEQKFATESAVLAALEFVQYLNSRSMVRTQVVHGVNISMSIPHDVRNYGCGSTPICIASDRLVGSGVVVVAAAGNRGWSEQEMGFGSFAFCSITDPGNARDVITVGSTHPTKPHIYGVSYFSSRGPTGDGRSKPDLVAPGEGIRAPIRNMAEAELSGTSMAAPFVSGAAAMLMARHPELVGRPLEIKKVLCTSATDLERERYFQGHGLLDVLRALQSR